jgi:SAM-dependent methyltransferase
VTAAAYGDALAPYYDQMYDPGGQDGRDAAAFVAALLPPGGRVLELGVGTGRIAVPLAAAGAAVTGVDASERMLAALADRDPAGRVKAVRADMTNYADGGGYDVVLVACNTLFMVPDPDRQVACLTAAARALAPGGRLVVEVYSPLRFVRGSAELVQVRHLAADRVMVDTVRCDPHAQLLLEVHVLLGAGPPLTVSEVSRFAWPAELDRMAELAGLTLAARTGGWRGEVFDVNSDRHVSVYSGTARPHSSGVSGIRPGDPAK